MNSPGGPFLAKAVLCGSPPGTQLRASEGFPASPHKKPPSAFAWYRCRPWSLSSRHATLSDDPILGRRRRRRRRFLDLTALQLSNKCLRYPRGFLLSPFPLQDRLARRSTTSLKLNALLKWFIGLQPHLRYLVLVPCCAPTPVWNFLSLHPRLLTNFRGRIHARRIILTPDFLSEPLPDSVVESPPQCCRL